MQFIPRDQVQWKAVNYLKTPTGYQHQLILPRPLADWDVYDYWERARVESMREHLKPGMTLFDVGTEQGWCNLVYASMVGPENMVLIEPTQEFWPNIRATWEKNYTLWPRAFYHGLVSDKTTDEDTMIFEIWPFGSDGPLIDRNKYQYIHDNDGVPEMRLDDLVDRSGVVPQALTIDVEGAELLVLEGAYETLDLYHPLVWVSIHPDLMERDYKFHPDQLHVYMANFGYVGQHLGTDHEEHWFFQ